MINSSTAILSTLKDFAVKELDQALEKLSHLNKLVDEAKSKLDMLQQYRQDYVNRLQEMLSQSLDANAYQNYQSFLRKLDQAILGQEDVVQANLRDANQQRGIWQECQKKKMSYEVLIERSAKRAHHAAQRTEQKMMDEFATRSHKSYQQ